MNSHDLFIRRTAPILGDSAAEELFQSIDSPEKYDSIAAFFRGEFSDTAMHLEPEDWSLILETVERVSGEMDIDTLTVLMGDLLSRGILQ
ncbi:MAG: hypothetical protein LBB43_05600 [Spirochaetaceae bacterium]|jgi:hypothetical protein|nr:hypothetical protein [Spirochaetaceae bacterium]